MECRVTTEIKLNDTESSVLFTLLSRMTRAEQTELGLTEEQCDVLYGMYCAMGEAICGDS